MWDKSDPADAPDLEAIFAPGGVLARLLPRYEFRPSQLEMAQAVLDVIRFGAHLCVEAGTGTGKTLAYLIPALFSSKRVIVSTATRNLQEQIFFKDIPFIRRHLAPDLKVSYMKGRSNYLCLKKLEEARVQRSLFRDQEAELRVLEKWAATTTTGDAAELDWMGDGDPLWRSLDARSETCLGSKCYLFDDCFVTRMRRDALKSEIIVVNHALFFANLALKNDEIGQILPDFGTVILDEAHEIEDIAAGHFGIRLSNHQINDLLRSLEQAFAPSPVRLKRLRTASQRSAALFSACPAVEGRHSLNFYQDHQHPQGGSADLRDRLRKPYQALRTSIDDLLHGLLSLKEAPDESEALARRLEQTAMALDALFLDDDAHSVYWWERRGRGIFFHLTPIRVSPLLRQQLFDKIDTAVLTSATLAIENRFDFVKDRLGVPDPAELIVAGEFDYTSQAILYVPSGFPEPRSPLYQERAWQETERILSITDGHAFLLFTSFRQLNAFHEHLSARLPYRFLRQGDHPRTHLLDVFRNTPRAVLCATAGFWHGVDVQGDALRAVVIDKLPFHVPSEPVVAARSHHMRLEGLDPFSQYSLPEAIITLKQGLGRLIRSREDRGILAVLDARLRTKAYGKSFLASLPDCPLTDKIEDLENFYRKTPS